MSATRMFSVYPSRRDPGYYAVIVLYSDKEEDSVYRPMIAMCNDQGNALMIAAALNHADDQLLDTARLIGEVLEDK